MELKEMENVGVLINTEAEFKEFLSIMDGHWGDVPEWLSTMWPTIKNNCVYTDKAGWDHAHNCINQITLAQFKERNGIMKWKQGDILVNGSGEKREIKGICGAVIFPSAVNDFDSVSAIPWSESQLSRAGFALKTDEPEMVELTLEDVAKLKGIPVETLRIKD